MLQRIRNTELPIAVTPDLFRQSSLGQHTSRHVKKFGSFLFGEDTFLNIMFHSVHRRPAQ